jgi:hypothetical protein
MQRNQYLAELQNAIRAVHGCESVFVSTNKVRGMLEDRLAWQGEVETFDLIDHPKAKRCYAWGYEEGGEFHATAVLELPPVDSPASAVNGALAAKTRMP